MTLQELEKKIDHKIRTCKQAHYMPKHLYLGYDEGMLVTNSNNFHSHNLKAMYGVLEIVSVSRDSWVDVGWE